MRSVIAVEVLAPAEIHVVGNDEKASSYHRNSSLSRARKAVMRHDCKGSEQPKANKTQEQDLPLPVPMAAQPQSDH